MDLRHAVRDIVTDV